MNDLQLTVFEAVELFLIEGLQKRGFAATTQQNYQIDLHQLGEFLQRSYGITGVELVQLRHLEGYIQHLSNTGQTSATVRRKVAAIRSFFSFLSAGDYRIDNPTEELLPPERDARNLRYLTEREYHRLLNAARHDVRDTAIIQLYLQTGMRLSELVQLRLSDIGLPEGEERTGKASVSGRHARTVPLNWKACETLSAYLTIRPAEGVDDSLFVSRFRSGLGPRQIERLVTNYLRAADIPNASVHTLRHTYATHAVLKGITPGTLKDRLGVDDVAETTVYVEIAQEELQRQHEEL